MNLIFRIIEFGNLEWKKSVELREEVLRKPMRLCFTVAELSDERENLHIAGFFK